VPPRQQAKIAILIATYNGENFLESQLLSLAAQSCQNIDVFANDDGSEDSTLEILKTYEESGLIKKILQTQKVGPTNSFLNLLRNTDGYEYVALCDQDDVWDSDKMSLSLNELGVESPEIVFSERKYIDSTGRVMGMSPKVTKTPSLQNALIENVVYGNTIVMNAKAKELVIEEIPDGVDLDHWIYIIISLLGQIHFIPSPLVSYRIHDSNHVGISRLRSIRRFPGNVLKIRKSVFCLLRGYSEKFSSADIEVLQNYLEISECRSPLRIVRALKKSGLYRQKSLETLAYKIALLASVVITSNPNLKS
jgi:glycosyltransferase involved in cell wall biosynthesis